MHKILCTLYAVVISAGLGACSPSAEVAAPSQDPTPDPTTAIPQPTVQPVAQPATTVPEPTATPDAAPVIPAPQRIEFASLDGTPLVATFYPPAHSGAPGLLLIHMLGSSREVWDPYALRWQDPQNGPAGGFAVLAIDLRGHGESGGGRDRAAMVGDGSAALALLRTLPDVDADRIAIIGASIGADVAVDACAGGCVAAASLSPGGFSDVPYRQALEVLAAAQGPVVLCVAAQEDAPSPQTCDEGQGAGLADYRVQLYEGSAHGTDMLGENYDPPLFELLTAFLSEIAEP